MRLASRTTPFKVALKSQLLHCSQQPRMLTAMVARLSNFAAFYLGWFACVVGAARGWPAIGPLAVLALIGVHLSQQNDRGRELTLILMVGAIGSMIDSTQALLGVFAFVGAPGVWLCPPWLTSLWLIFGTTFNSSMSWLAGRYRLAVVVGAVSGPFSYYCAVRLGVIEFPHPMFSVATLALVWAVTVPGLMWLRDRLTARVPAASIAV